ncbi:MAG: cobalt transporter CbiM [Deltaproteobacteria bacterium]|nr:cobalt transporter CbiM [Deltaproteobacteria bacterium]
MHISEGVLSPAILTGGAVLAATGVGIGLKSMDYEEIPYLGILTASFFVASLIHLPVGPSSVHLILNGMLGLILGWKAFPAILVGLALQALLFQFGGITTLGINTFNMALPAVTCYYLFGWGVKKSSGRPVFIITAFAAGCCAVLFAGILAGFSLYLNGDAFLPVAKLLVAAHLPVMLIEGILTATCALFLRKVRPDILEGYCV